MALTIFISGTIIVVIAFVCGYYRGDRRSNSLNSRLHSSNLEIKELRDENNDLKNKLQLTFEDAVTNLLGWQLFEDRIIQNVKESERYHLTMGVVYVDIDDFKVINDALSYEVGDELLREVATRLQECIRQVDSISRFAQDTFVILLAHLNKPETAAIVTQRILQSLSLPFQIGEHEVYLTACIGVSLYPGDGQDAQSLLRNAHQALYLAKEQGKHVCRFYEEKMHVQSQREMEIYNSLSRESVFQELLVNYQPIVDVSNRSIFCMNALLLWQQPELGLIDSRELFEYAEKQRKLNAISIWLLKNACKQFQAWHVEGVKAKLLSVSLSVKQLENSNFIYQLSHILQESNFNPEWLLIEIKDSFLEESFDVLEKAFNMLNYLGIKLAIDNFGSDFFALRYLKNITVHYLKLDKSFIDDIVENEQTQALVRSILSFAQSLSMQVIVQGIENEQQMNVCKELGITLMQGSLLGEPQPGNIIINTVAVPTV